MESHFCVRAGRIKKILKKIESTYLKITPKFHMRFSKSYINNALTSLSTEDSPNYLFKIEFSVWTSKLGNQFKSVPMSSIFHDLVNDESWQVVEDRGLDVGIDFGGLDEEDEIRVKVRYLDWKHGLTEYDVEWAFLDLVAI